MVERNRRQVAIDLGNFKEYISCFSASIFSFKISLLEEMSGVGISCPFFLLPIDKRQTYLLILNLMMVRLPGVWNLSALPVKQTIWNAGVSEGSCACRRHLNQWEGASCFPILCAYVKAKRIGPKYYQPHLGYFWS